MKRYTLYLFLFVCIFGLISCTSSGNGENEVVLNDTGTLVWGLSPAVDGTGMTFRKTDEVVFGIPGNRSDYAEYFADPDTNRAQVQIDYVITGEEEKRGWNIPFRMIEVLEIRTP